MANHYTDVSWVPKDWTDVQDYLATDLFLAVQKCQSPGEVFHVVAKAHYDMALFPLGFAIHCILLSLKFRDDQDVSRFVYSNPAVSLMAFLLSVQFGCLSSSLLIGEVPLACYLNYGDIPTIGIAVGAWFLVFFSPFDFFYKLCKISPVNFVLYVGGSLRVTRNIMSGVVQAHQKYPNAPLAIMANGTLKGTGSVFALNLFKTLCVTESLQKGRISDKVHITFTTKMCFILSLVFTLVELNVLQVPRQTVLFCGAMLVINSKVLGGHLTTSGDILSAPATLLWKLVTVFAPEGSHDDDKRLPSSSSSSPSKRRRKNEDRDHQKKD